MKIPAVKLVHGVEYPLWIMEFVRCPDGLYGIVVNRNPKTVQDRIPQPIALSQIIIDEKWIKDEEEHPIEKKVLVESITPKKTTSTTTKKTSTTTKKKVD